MDVAHAPVGMNGYNVGSLPGVPNLIYILYPDDVGILSQWNIITFDTNTDLYGTVSTSPVLPFNVGGSTSTFVGIKNHVGLPTHLFIINVGAGGHLQQSTWDPATLTWTAPVAIPGTANCFPVGQIFATPTSIPDNWYVAYGDSPTGDLFMGQSVNGAPLGTLTNISGTGLFDFTRTDQIIFNQPVADSIWFTWNEGNDCYAMTTTNATFPAFTKFHIANVPASGTLGYSTFGVDAAGTLNLFVAWVDVSGPPIDKILQYRFDGVATWNFAGVFYDEVTNPPPNSVAQPIQFIHDGQALLQFSNGDILFAISLETIDPMTGLHHCTGIALIGIVPPPTPIILRRIDHRTIAILPLPNPLIHCPSDENYVIGRVSPATQKRKRSNCVYDFRSK